MPKYYVWERRGTKGTKRATFMVTQVIMANSLREVPDKFRDRTGRRVQVVTNYTPLGINDPEDEGLELAIDGPGEGPTHQEPGHED